MTGYGVVLRDGGTLRALDHGCIQTVPDRELPARLLIIHQALTELIEEHRPDAVGVERLFFNKNVQTAFAVGQARGVVLLAAAQHGLSVNEYAPAEIKKAVVGTGGATKEQVQFMLTRLLRLKSVPQPSDAADGVAAALACLMGAQLPRIDTCGRVREPSRPSARRTPPTRTPVP